MNIRDFLRDTYQESDARHRRAAGITLDHIITRWGRELAKLNQGQAVSVYWFTIRQFLTPEQQALGGRWVVQEDGTLMKDL